jgi:hypothetical protein
LLRTFSLASKFLHIEALT